jgi:hypothetical protein
MGPLMAISNSDPMGSVFARGDVFSKAAGKPTKPIALFGVWLIFGPSCAMFLGLLYRAIASVIEGEEKLSAVIGGMVCSFLPALLCGAILFRTTRNYFRYQAEEERKEKREKDR